MLNKIDYLTSYMENSNLSFFLYSQTFSYETLFKFIDHIIKDEFEFIVADKAFGILSNLLQPSEVGKFVVSEMGTRIDGIFSNCFVLQPTAYRQWDLIPSYVLLFN